MANTIKPADKILMLLKAKVVKGIPTPKLEYRFHHKRRFRFDLAWREVKVAVEIEGGDWIRGRHQRPDGFNKDCEKYNLAAELGWVVLRYTGRMVKERSMECLEQIARVIANRRGEWENQEPHTEGDGRTSKETTTQK